MCAPHTSHRLSTSTSRTYFDRALPRTGAADLSQCHCNLCMPLSCWCAMIRSVIPRFLSYPTAMTVAWSPVRLPSRAGAVACLCLLIKHRTSMCAPASALPVCPPHLDLRICSSRAYLWAAVWVPAPPQLRRRHGPSTACLDLLCQRLLSYRWVVSKTSRSEPRTAWTAHQPPAVNDMHLVVNSFDVCMQGPKRVLPYKSGFNSISGLLQMQLSASPHACMPAQTPAIRMPTHLHPHLPVGFQPFVQLAGPYANSHIAVKAEFIRLLDSSVCLCVKLAWPLSCHSPVFTPTQMAVPHTRSHKASDHHRSLGSPLFSSPMSPQAGLVSEATVSGYHADNVGPALLGGFVLIRCVLVVACRPVDLNILIGMLRS